MKRRTYDPIALAMAGHAFRATGNTKKSEKYENPLTDLVNLIMAECAAHQSMTHRSPDTHDEGETTVSKE